MTVPPPPLTVFVLPALAPSHTQYSVAAVDATVALPVPPTTAAPGAVLVVAHTAANAPAEITLEIKPTTISFFI
jgi:hypothetical protein